MRTDAEKISLFRSLFTGLNTAYGTFDLQTGRARQVKAPVTDAVIRTHLLGGQAYGVYLLTGTMTRAVVADFDDDDLWSPKQFMAGARAYGLPTYLERSKSKGFHVWMFFEECGLVAAKARAVMRRILAEIEKPHTEVFPKQDTLDTRVSFGNFIHAPLFGRYVPAGRTVFLDPCDPTRPPPDQWALLAEVQRVPESLLDEIIELNDLEVSATARRSRRSQAAGDRVYGLPPCARRMLSDGVRENQRVACFRLAVQLKRTGLPFGSTVAVLANWAKRNRPTGDKRIITHKEILTQAACAYDKEYRACGCEEPVVAQHCDTSCRVNLTVRKPHDALPTGVAV
jgi:hypothetical protein